jgi:hypothetical protein
MAASRILAVAVAVAVGVVAVAAFLTVAASVAEAQTSVADLLRRQKAPEEQPKTYLEEVMLFGYVENSFVWNLGRTGRGGSGHGVKDPSDRYRFGYGLVLTAGIDSQKNHAVGIFRDGDDSFPFRNTEKFDLQEAYASYKFLRWGPASP